MNTRQPNTDYYERAEEFRGETRPYATAGYTRTGRAAVPPSPLSRVADERSERSGYIAPGSAPLAPYRQPARPVATRRPVYQERQRVSARSSGMLDRAMGLSFRTRIGAGILLILGVALVVYTFITILFQGFSFVRDGATFGFFNSGAHIVQIDSFVGHNEQNGQPTKFLAMNVNRQVTVIELPGGDPNKTRVIVGPYLYGQGEDKAQVSIKLSDVNADSKPDLVVSVKGEDTVFINDGTTFRPMTADERAKLAGGTK